MFRLPVTGTVVEIRDFSGAEDMLLLESTGHDMEISIALADRLARRSDGAELHAASLPITDLEAWLLGLRSALLGDEVLSHGKCLAEHCGAQTDISFRISEYLEHHRPRMPRNVQSVKEEPGRFALLGSVVTFRLLTAGDLAAVEGLPDAETELARRTIRPADSSCRDQRRVQQAMEMLAPPLAQEVEGSCPGCGLKDRLFFCPHSFVLQELRYKSMFLYEDVHLLAERYHWPEEKLLALPSKRRAQYAELAMREGDSN
jgi:hypothetical protein